jgi:tricorn protease
MVIDFEGIEDRIQEFPVPEARYDRLVAIKNKLFYSELPVEGALGRGLQSERPASRLHVYDLEALKAEVFAEGVASFTVSRDGKTMAYRSQGRVRVVKTGAKPDARNPAGDPKDARAGRAHGFVDLDRIRLSIVPQAEWRQMYREMWRLQRDHFWTSDLSQVDWQEAHDRYLPILARVATRGELSDLAWELQGELGTSHAYEMGGDLRSPPAYQVGKLGADLRHDGEHWVIARVVHGDSWDRQQDSPLNALGVNVVAGDRLLAIDDQRLDAHTAPGQLLVHKAGVDVALQVQTPGAPRSRRVVVRPLWSDAALRYRAWVEGNRTLVHERSAGRVGYVHVPDMGPRGFAEFYRYFVNESYRGGLVVDVRFNGGGHVSQLLLEKLARKRLGYSVSHHLQPVPRPSYAVEGPIVCLTNEHAASDGDIFSHSFKMLGLGPLIGKRTWGGVVGIDGRNSLVDGTLVTQPEYSTWFYDVGFGIENRGTEPDVEVDERPQDYRRGVDVQLETAVATALAGLAATPARVPDFSQRPSRARP